MAMREPYVSNVFILTQGEQCSSFGHFGTTKQSFSLPLNRYRPSQENHLQRLCRVYALVYKHRRMMLIIIPFNYVVDVCTANMLSY